MGNNYFLSVIIIVSMAIVLPGCTKTDENNQDSPEAISDAVQANNPPEAKSDTVQRNNSPKENVTDEKIVCDKFEIKESLDGDSLEFSIETDLPDFTEVIASVSRGYYEKGDSGTLYSRDYFSKNSTIGKFRNPQVVSVADSVFNKSLQEQMNLLAQMGEPFQVSKIQESIEISFTVHLGQDNPRFGTGNSNLVGKMVSEKGARVVRVEKDIHKPFGSKGSISNEPTFASATTLKIGKNYSLSSRTPLMPEYDPADPLDAISRTKELAANSVITVQEIKKKGNTPWYKVQAASNSGLQLGNGWINSNALLGQTLKIVSR